LIFIFAEYLLNDHIAYGFFKPSVAHTVKQQAQQEIESGNNKETIKHFTQYCPKPYCNTQIEENKKDSENDADDDDNYYKEEIMPTLNNADNVIL
jgi:hypothetical protein